MIQVFEDARVAQAARPSTAELARIFLRYHDVVLARQSELLDAIQKETGKARGHAFEEVLDVALTSRYYARTAAKALKTQRRKGGLPLLIRAAVEHDPIGVVGMITPWNYPLSLTISDAIPALFAGNAVVLKPDPRTPETALLAAEMLYECGLPRKLFQVVPGPGETVGQEIARNCDFLMFTGSTATGRKLGAIAGERLIGFSAELGGKNPLLIDESADLDKAVDVAIQACFTNTGQLCISIERIYVHRSLAREFTEKFVQRTRELKVGVGGWECDLGILISEEHAAKVHGMVTDAIEKGAHVLTGGTPPEGRLYQPTILKDVPDDATLKRTEVFGPVVFIEVVDSRDEAVALANDSEFGLNASVVAKPRVGRQIASRLQAGTVNINEGYAAAWASIDTPMGGWKASGLGRRHGVEGLLKYTETRSVAEQRLGLVSGDGIVSREKYAQVMTAAMKLGKRIL